MLNKIILRTSNELGNQMFMYASAFGISKQMQREMLIDDETAFLSKKNISKYGLNCFNISSSLADKEYKFIGLDGYIKRKFLIKTDFIRLNKFFFIEKKNINKISRYDLSFINKKFNKNLYIEGHFESEKYFFDYKDLIKKEFSFRNIKLLQNNIFFNELTNTNSVAICLRQNRFTEGANKNTEFNKLKSWNYTLEQIKYINKSVDILKSKLSNPKFFLWTNDFKGLNNSMFCFNFEKILLDSIVSTIDKRFLSLFLLTNAKHFITIPSTFNWWGAWLSDNKGKFIFRPSKNFFKNFRVNNLDFWPDSWISVD